MSDETSKPGTISKSPPPPKAPRKYRTPPNYRELVLKHIDDKKVRGVCPACGANAWQLEDEPAVMVMSPKLEIGDRLHLPAALMSCKNCGFVRLFTLGFIDGLGIDDLEDPN